MKYTDSFHRLIKLPASIIMFLLCCLVSYSCGGSDDGISEPPGNSGTDPAPDPDDPSDDWRTLYNGIILPSVWPPKNINISSYEPMKVPYLETPPEVVPIDIGRQLFFDNFLIDNTDLERKFYKPKKYAQNPILKPETALETSKIPGASAKDGGVWWEPREQIFKMWYEAGWLNKMAYATSKDGVNWMRPDLNNGSNELLTLSRFPANSCAVVLDYDASDNERYKMFLRSPNADATDNAGYCMISSNGKQWSWFTKTGPCGDRSTMFYNPFRKKWVFSIRTLGVLGNSPHGRARYYREHSDFLTGAVWTKADVVFWCNADNKDTPDPEFNLPPELYNLNAVGYESVMLGLHQILLDENEIAKAANRPKITELKVSFSRDGFHWDRPYREAFIPATRVSGSWDRGYVQSVGGICTVVGDQLRFYYIGFKGGDPSSYMHSNGATGMATLRRDGFASMSTTGEGSLTTRPVKFSGKYMFVNVNCPAGELKVEILDKNNKVIDGFSADKCKAVTIDSTIQQVEWNSISDLSSLAGEEVRFRFKLKNGDLYAFWVSPSTNGESNGYVAGGGPGYTSNKDTEGKKAYEKANDFQKF